MTPAEQKALEERAWNLAGDVLMDSPLEGDEWVLAREMLASEILWNWVPTFQGGEE